MRETRWKCIFRAKFLAQGFVVRALMPQGWVESPNHSVFLNNLLVSLIYCESLKKIGEMACVTPARSSRGQTWRSSSLGTISYFSFRAHWLANDTAPPTFFLCSLNRTLRGKSKEVSFSSTMACVSPVTPQRYGRKFPALSAFALLVDQIVFFQCYSTPVLMYWPNLSLRWSFFFSK